MNQARPGAARLTYREVTAGAWTEATTGGEFGVRYDWPDGGQEIHPFPSRRDAELAARGNNLGSSSGVATVVSRPLSHGDWWVAESAQPEPAR